MYINFDSIKNTVVHILGKNGLGKTTVGNAIRYILFGSGRGKVKELKEDILYE